MWGESKVVFYAKGLWERIRQRSTVNGAMWHGGRRE